MTAKKGSTVNETTSTAGATAAKANSAPITADKITAVSKSVPMPEFASASNRGSKSAFHFDDLDVGESFGVIGRDARSLSSIISSAHRRHMVNKTDANGNVVYKTRKAKDANGVEMEMPTQEAAQVRGREFKAADVDPKKDPDGASVRIWRTA